MNVGMFVTMNATKEFYDKMYKEKFEEYANEFKQKSTQLIFCDLSTPKGDGTFNVYEDIRNKLIEKGAH